MSGRTSDDIRREIDWKRDRMDDTVDALERKLSPGQLLDHALWMVRGSDSGSEKARAVGDAVSGFAKDHPIPVALMSAGAAWLAAESRAASNAGAGTYARAEGRVGPYRGDAIDDGPLRDEPHRFDGDGRHDGASATGRAKEKAGELKDRVADAADGAGDRLRHAGESVRDRMSELGDSTRERMYAAGERGSALADRARQQASLRAHQARQRYDATLEDNPLSIGAAAFGLGLAAGLSAPTTRWEDEHMGRTADALKGEARDIAKESGRAAKHAGAEALSVAKREALPDGIVDEVKARAKRVASDAADAAKRTARDEGLTADALKQRAREAGEHVRDAARRDMS